MKKFAIAIHGGAGTILKNQMTPALEKAHLDGLREALNAGYKVLEEGGSSVNAVKAAVVVLEDNILFNAGRGSVFTNKGLHEMDAAIMDGCTLNAGAVSGVCNVRNPVELAFEVMLNSDHIFLSGEGANDFAAARGIKMEPDEYFFSEFRYSQWKSISSTGESVLDHSFIPPQELLKDEKFGTVGAVACDKHGNIAAATSTGGMTNKMYGRVGDSPIIGSGTYANNKTCAVSCTGHGELFIRLVSAYDVSCLREYKGLSLYEAMNIAVNEKLIKIGGEGGMIGADAEGNIAMLFNSAGMYRAAKSSDGRADEISIYR